MSENYYGFSLSTSGPTTSAAYYWVSLAQGAAYDGAAITIYPGNTNPTYFNYRSNSLQWQAAPGRITAGMTVVTSGSNIAGTLGVSPAVNVDITLLCYGAASQIGSVTLPAGQTEVAFNFPVTPSESLGNGGQAFLDKVSAKPE